jgi:hypothetical protein
MEEVEKKTRTRKGSTPIKVYCLPEERGIIETNAQMAGLSTSSYLLRVGQGYQVKGIMDYEGVRELVRVNGDLGRLGGLLKMWLTNEERLIGIRESTIRELLEKIDETQTEMRLIMKSIVQPRAEP